MTCVSPLCVSACGFLRVPVGGRRLSAAPRPRPLWGDEAGDGSNQALFCAGGFRAALLALVPGFEAATGLNVAMQWGSLVAGTPTSIPARMDRANPWTWWSGRAPAWTECSKRAGSSRGTPARWRDRASALPCAPAPASPRWAPRRPSRARCLPAARSRSRPAPAAFYKLFARLAFDGALSAKIIRAEVTPVGELLPVAGIDFVGPLPALCK
jgi:hypothetical protein